MHQIKTKSIARRTDRVRSDWVSAFHHVGDVAHMTESYLDVRAAVDDARAAFVAEARKFRIEIDEYEFNTTIANVLFNTGFHRDRRGNVRKLNDLILLEQPRVGHEQGRACIRFAISALLENGSWHTSRETLEWLDIQGALVAEESYADSPPEAYVETSRALDASMTDVEKAVRAKLGRLVRLMREHAV